MGKKNINSILIFIFRLRYRSYETSVLWKYFYHFLIYIFKEHLKNDFFYPLYNFKFLKKPMIFLSKLSGIDKVNNVEGKR